MNSMIPKGSRHLQIDWKIDAFLKELLDVGVDVSIRMERSATNELSIIVTHRKSARDGIIFQKCLYSAFGL